MSLSQIEKTDVVIRSFFRKSKDETVKLILGTFGFIAALAWNEVIQNYFTDHDDMSKIGPLLYAITITIIAVVVAMLIGGFAS